MLMKMQHTTGRHMYSRRPRLMHDNFQRMSLSAAELQKNLHAFQQTSVTTVSTDS